MSAAIMTSHPGKSDDPFDYWWNIDGDCVEPPNHRRNGLSGVKKIVLPDKGTVFVKIQRNHLHRSLRHPIGRPTAFREAEAIAACHKLCVKVLDIVYCGTRKQQQGWQTVLVTRELQGFISLQQWLDSALFQNDNGNIRELVIQQIARTLSMFHLARWQHGCLYPKHIFCILIRISLHLT